MARNFLAFPFAPYAGIYSSKSFDTASGQPKGLMVALDILWTTYNANGHPLGTANPNFSVAINLNAAGPNSVSQSWTMQSVYIDNEAVDFAVYVYFNDTMFTVSCPANSAGWYQIFTNARQALVSAIGITDLAIATGQRTRLFFTDVVMVPSLDQEVQNSVALWKASPVITRGNTILNTNYGTPVLGDQLFASGDVSLVNNTQPTAMWGTPYDSGFLYLTALSIYGYALFTNVNPSGTNGEMVIQNQATGDILIRPKYWVPGIGPDSNGVPGPSEGGTSQIMSLTGMNIKLDATVPWRAFVTVGVTQGLAQIYSAFTQTPI